jgi:predicted 2-oxoglutarate/Fe(II)-dependent dioxygenase YbiX
MYSNDSVLLITKEHLFKYTQLQGNVDIDKVTPFIKVAQDTEVEAILGTKLYRRILTDVQNNTLTGNYLTLVSNYIQPMLIHYTMSDFFLFHGYEISNAGILRNSPENTNLPEKVEIDSLVKRQRDIAETYRAKAVDYLSYYPQLFPEYSADQQSGLYPNSNPSNYTGWKL